MSKVESAEESKFTYKNLLDLNDPQKAYTSPLAVICHVDVNAFFAQYEQNRLNLGPDDPVVCLQWNSIIAVSYAARKFGISRMDSLQSALKKCPKLVVAHTAVFKKGEPIWKYVDYRPSPANHKVSLDPYRRESRKMMRIFRSFCDLVEKASVDESFMDLGRLVFKRMVKLFPEIFDDTKEWKLADKLPLLTQKSFGSANLQWKGFVIPKEDEDEQNGPVINDWDDVAILIGSNLAYEIRKKVVDTLNYTTSAGVGRVKTLAKLASGYKKPNAQTVVRNSTIPEFLAKFSLHDFWSMGGKAGELVSSRLLDGRLDDDGEKSSNQIGFIRDTFSLKDLDSRLDHDHQLAERVYKIVRGELTDPLTARIDLKSMTSNKIFRGKAVNGPNDMYPWFDVFVGDLVLRLQDLDEEDGRIRRPTKLGLIISSFGITRSKQVTISPVKEYDQITKTLTRLSHCLLIELGKSWSEKSHRISMYPCQRGALEISGFKDLRGFQTIDNLMSGNKKLKREEQYERHKFVSKKSAETTSSLHYESRKRRKQNAGILSFLTADKKLKHQVQKETLDTKLTDISMAYTCPECGKRVESSSILEHKDYHLAVKLDAEINH